MCPTWPWKYETIHNICTGGKKIPMQSIVCEDSILCSLSTILCLLIAFKTLPWLPPCPLCGPHSMQALQCHCSGRIFSQLIYVPSLSSVYRNLPMYIWLPYLHRILNTMPFFSGGTRFFNWTRGCLGVLENLKTVQFPQCDRVYCILSPKPSTPGK